MRNEFGRNIISLEGCSKFFFLFAVLTLSYDHPLIFFAPRHAGQTTVPLPWQFMQGFCIAVLLGFRPWPWQTGQVTEPFPLQSGQVIIEVFPGI